MNTSGDVAQARPYRNLIVIPTLNEARYIAALLDLVLAEAPELDARIVVADGGSTDGTIDIVGSYADTHDIVTLHHNPKRIQSAAINGAAEAFGEGMTYLIRLDAHATYPADFCRTLVNEAQRMEADAVVIPMTTVGKSLFQRAVATAQNSLIGTGGSAHRTGKSSKWVDHGHHALVSAPAFRAVGGYDESFKHNEDAEFDFRFTAAGYRIWLTDATFMYYYPRATPMSLFRQYFGYGKGRARNIFKHNVIPKARQMLPLAIVPAAALALLGFVHWIAVVPLLAWALLCLALGVHAKINHTDNGLPAIGTPLVGVAAMIMHIAWSSGFWSQVVRRVVGSDGR